MVKYVDECVGCSSLGMPCLGSSCPNRNVPRLYCDACEEELDSSESYEDDNGNCLCRDCLIEYALERYKVSASHWF